MLVLEVGHTPIHQLRSEFCISVHFGYILLKSSSSLNISKFEKLGKLF